MNVFDYAMKMEQDGEAFYRDLAGKTSNKGLQTILNMIADEEVKHFNIFKEMRDGSGSTDAMPASTILAEAKNIFQTMADSGEKFTDDAEHKMHYEKARQIEEEAVAFYTEKAAETDVAAEKNILLAIADEEKRHVRLFQEFIDFVVTPERWLEDAEWNHLDEY